MKKYVIKDHRSGYFRGTFDGDVVWTWEQPRAMRFHDKGIAELTMVEFAPHGDVIKLVKRADLTGSADHGK